MESQMREIQILVPPVAVLRNGELYEENRPVYLCESLAFGCHGFYSDVFEYDILMFP